MVVSDREISNLIVDHSLSVHTIIIINRIFRLLHSVSTVGSQLHINYVVGGWLRVLYLFYITSRQQQPTEGQQREVMAQQN